MTDTYVAPYNVIVIRYQDEREVFNHLTREDAYARYRSLTFGYRYPDLESVRKGNPIVFALQENEPTHGNVIELDGARVDVMKKHLAWVKEREA